jgi:hypothetical protein
MEFFILISLLTEWFVEINVGILLHPWKRDVFFVILSLDGVRGKAGSHWPMVGGRCQISRLLKRNLGIYGQKK